MKNRKFVTVSLAAALAIGTITANGVLVSADAEKGTIKVAASATPHAEILEEAKPILEKEGWDLEVTVFDDYVQPNLVVESGAPYSIHTRRQHSKSCGTAASAAV